MNKKTQNIVITIVIIIAIAAIAFFIIRGKTTGAVVSEDAAKWIGAHSTVYTQVGCSHCVDQENLFGDNWKYIHSVDYFTNPQAFIDANITGTPTWVINGQQYVGVQSITTLENLTGYKG
jgi:glutaredoxin